MQDTVYVTQQNWNDLVREELKYIPDHLPKKVQKKENLVFYLRTIAHFQLMDGKLLRAVALGQYARGVESGDIPFKSHRSNGGRELTEREMEKKGNQAHARFLAKELGIKYTDALRQVKMMDALPKEALIDD